MLQEFAFVIAGLVVIAYASDRVVRILNGISMLFRVPKFVLAFLILGLGTSLPDMIVAGVSASEGQMQMVLGMVIGSNIIVLTIMLGVVALIKGDFRVRERTVLENFGWIFFVLMIPLFLLVDGRLSYIDGILLIIVYLMYAYTIYTQEKEVWHGKDSGVQLELELSENPTQPAFYRQKQILSTEFLKLLVFLGVLILTAEFVVQNAKIFSLEAGIPPILLGFTLIAFGVTLPQLAIEITALRAREEEVIWGDIIGGFITELTLVLGVAALFTGSGVVIELSQAFVGYAFMFISFILVFFFTFTKKSLTKTEGLALLFLYLVFLTIQFDFLLLGGKGVIG